MREVPGSFTETRDVCEVKEVQPLTFYEQTNLPKKL